MDEIREYFQTPQRQFLHKSQDYANYPEGKKTAQQPKGQ